MRTTYFWKTTHEPEPGTMYVSISRQNLRGAEGMKKISCADAGLEAD